MVSNHSDGNRLAPEPDSSRVIDAWERFVGGAVSTNLPVRSAILKSWERSKRFSVSLRAEAAPLLDDEQRDRLNERNRDLIDAAGPVLKEAETTLAGLSALMLLTDANGVGLQAAGDTSALHAGIDIALSHGGQWDEQSAGTNGIGTALATGQPMFVHASEHYCKGIQGWSCGAAPIFDPLDGSIIGILDISAKADAWNQHGLALAVSAAKQIEQRLALRRGVQQKLMLEACLATDEQRRGGVILTDAHGRISFVCHRAPPLLSSWFGASGDRLRPGVFVVDPAHGERRNDAPAIEPDWIKPVEVRDRALGFIISIPERPAPRRISRAPDSNLAFPAIIGTSEPMRRALDQVSKVAPLDIPVLFEGETGVGKELFARAVHDHGLRRGGPFISFNCGAVSREMIGSELFGYVAGAFTGANPKGRLGHFEEADGGTLCLDEIGELPLDIQPFLLRVLEDGIVTRMGANRGRKIDVRVVAMTNRCLTSEVKAGRFRRDLLHRLNVVSIEVPPLRSRTSDIEKLIEHFSHAAAGKYGLAPIQFTPRAQAALLTHDWPGNVRELRNVVERACIFASGNVADVDSLPRDIQPNGATPQTPHDACLDDSDSDVLERALREAAGNFSLAAQRLGISRSTLYRRMASCGISSGSKGVRQSLGARKHGAEGRC